MEDFGLGDGWRLKNPSKREYTFLPGASVIIFFLSNNSIAQKLPLVWPDQNRRDWTQNNF